MARNPQGFGGDWQVRSSCPGGVGLDDWTASAGQEPEGGQHPDILDFKNTGKQEREQEQEQEQEPASGNPCFEDITVFNTVEHQPVGTPVQHGDGVQSQ